MILEMVFHKDIIIKMKKGMQVKPRTIPAPVDPFERMKRVYINQISKTDSQPQKVIFD